MHYLRKQTAILSLYRHKVAAVFTVFLFFIFIFENPVELAHLTNLPNISAKLKSCGCQMVNHFSIIHGLGCLTSVI